VDCGKTLISCSLQFAGGLETAARVGIVFGMKLEDDTDDIKIICQLREDAIVLPLHHTLLPKATKLSGRMAGLETSSPDTAFVQIRISSHQEIRKGTQCNFEGIWSKSVVRVAQGNRSKSAYAFDSVQALAGSRPSAVLAGAQVGTRSRFRHEGIATGSVLDTGRRGEGFPSAGGPGSVMSGSSPGPR
jgi:hypothetical protein